MNLEELREAKDRTILEMRKEIGKLKTDRDALLEAAKEVVRLLHGLIDPPQAGYEACGKVAQKARLAELRAAIRKAEGE